MDDAGEQTAEEERTILLPSHLRFDADARTQDLSSPFFTTDFTDLFFNPLDCSQSLFLDTKFLLQRPPILPSLFHTNVDISFDSPYESAFFHTYNSSSLPLLPSYSAHSSHFRLTSDLSAAEFGFSFGGLPDAGSCNAAAVLPDDFPPIATPLTHFKNREAISLGKKRMRSLEDEIHDAGADSMTVNFDSDEQTDVLGEYNLIANGGNQKGKKGTRAKNLMAERRRRTKLNDMLYMLRSVVPKISKMNKASILGDAIDYLKELSQHINDLRCELEAVPMADPKPLMPTSTSFPYPIKEESCASSNPDSKNQSPMVEVKLKEGKTVNIHMLCAYKPNLLISTIAALENLGLNIQQASISCFSGFSLDVFSAEQCRESEDVLPEQIKAMLLASAGFNE